jgi:hypothetical protein
MTMVAWASIVAMIIAGIIVEMLFHSEPISRARWVAVIVTFLGCLALALLMTLKTAGSNRVSPAPAATTAKTVPPILKTERRRDRARVSRSVSTPVPLVQVLPSPRPRERVSQSLVLRDGDQEPLLDGQVSVGADFTRIGETDVPTLHVHGPGEGAGDHAILDASDRFEIEVAGRHYYLLATRDLQARTVTVRVEEKR